PCSASPRHRPSFPTRRSSDLYSNTLWRSVGFTESDAFTVSVITSVTNIVVTIVAILLVDKVGRRPMLLAGSVLMAISLTTMAVAFSFSYTVTDAGGQASTELDQPWSLIALICANVFVVGFGATWGPLVWVLLGEIRSEEHTSELQSRFDLVCRLLLEKKKPKCKHQPHE